MLKSISFIKRLEENLEINVLKKIISKFYIELRINHKIDVYIVSNNINSINELYIENILETELKNKNIEYIFLNEKKADDEDYKHLFLENRTSYGLRRSLGSLLTMSDKNNKKQNLITFFSYKGGVGRTTSLALTATYLARNGKNVFVLDCDFEAPGLINFFNTSQTNSNKNGLIEYLNDRKFLENTPIENYVYDVEKIYSGSGFISLMTAGNILSTNDDLLSYLEGIAKLDLQSIQLVNIFNELIDEINRKYNPDVILVDSRTGFNNIFGSLAKISSTVVVLAGDDIQNQPGIEYVVKTLNKMPVNSCFVLSILSNNFNKRFNNFKNYIQGISSFNTDIFYFDRQETLDYIGTPLEDKDDLDDFINGEIGSSQYHKFFKYINEITNDVASDVTDDVVRDMTDDVASDVTDDVASDVTDDVASDVTDDVASDVTDDVASDVTDDVASDVTDDVASDVTDDVTSDVNDDNITIQDRILAKLKNNLPNLYAENIDYSNEYIKNYFYFRPCMEDLLIQEKCILLGDKGTGKTAFYKALQIESFFKTLKDKSQKSNMSCKVLNITNFDKDNFEFIGFENYLKDEFFIKRFWMFFIWNSIFSKEIYESYNKNLLVNLKNFGFNEKIINILTDNDVYKKIEDDLDNLNIILRKSDTKLIITFDQLDNIVAPYLWNDVISPLVKIVIRFPFDYINPKLFLRRDLYERLGNLTNKNSFSSRIINLEWSQNEIFSYFLKIIFSYSKDDFFEFLDSSLENPSIIPSIKKKLKTKNIEHNQLPLDKHLIQPIINAFFGSPKQYKNKVMSTAYDDIYRNIQSADRTVNLRPFIDLISHAIEEQEEQDQKKHFRKNAIIGLAYCTSRQVRKNAVINYLGDLWNEKGNEFVKYFCQDLSQNNVDPKYKKNILDEDSFDNLLEEVKSNNSNDPAIKNGSLDEFKQILIANKIILPVNFGNKTKYGFAFLYTNYLGW